MRKLEIAMSGGLALVILAGCATQPAGQAPGAAAPSAPAAAPAPAAPAPQAAAGSVWSGVYTSAQADRGKTQYASQCASCHGDGLSGSDMAPPLAGPDFLSNWTGVSVGDLASRIQTTMPASAPGTLDDKVVSDIVAFILQANKFPAGSAELPSSPQVLQQIHIDATKPAS